MSPSSKRGQVLVLFAAILVLFLAFAALVLDGGIYMYHWQKLQVDLDAACVAAAISESSSKDEYAAFVSSLQSNDVPPIFYEPYETDARGLVIRGIQRTQDAKGFLAGLQGSHDLYLAQFMGIYDADIAVRTRCLAPQVSVLPIAVQEPWVTAGIADKSLEFPILGQGAEAVHARGSDFAGAVIPQVWCSDMNCSDKQIFLPALETNAPNVLKGLVRDTIMDESGSPLVPIGQRIPQIGGVSNHFLVKAMRQAGYEVGDQILVMVYNGTIDHPEPKYGNWENLEVIYYALAEITQVEANTVWTAFVEAPITSIETVRRLTTSRTIPWDWDG